MYRIQKSNFVCVEELRKFFEGLPLDAYLEQRYRYRRFSRFHVMSGNLTRLSHKYFVQAIGCNPLLGEIKRDYQELESNLTSSDDFKRLVLDFVTICESYRNETEVGVHQIRITSEGKMPGYPTPEGIHADGFDFVGILCVGRHNIQGGETCLYLEREAEPIYRRALEPGELLVFDDRKLLHYTSQIEASDSNSGTRDVFILTAAIIGSQTIENSSLL